MNTYQSEVHESNKLVVKEARNDVQNTDLIPKFAAGINELEKINNKVDTIRFKQEKSLTGISEDKKYTLERLIACTVDVAGATHAHAYAKDDHTLMEKVNFSTWKLQKMSQEKVISTASIILDEVHKLTQAELIEAGISAEELAEFAEEVAYFKEIKSAPREAIIDRTSYTNELAELFKQSAKLLNNSLDKLATQYKSKAPSFYLKYQAARNAIHRGPDKGKETDKGDK